MKQSLDMVLFTITNYDLVNATDLEEGIRMTITLKRKIMSEMMTTYFPSLLLMMITSATKMIDYWLILCQLVPFAQVVLLTAMEYLREEEKEEMEEKEVEKQDKETQVSKEEEI